MSIILVSAGGSVPSAPLSDVRYPSAMLPSPVVGSHPLWFQALQQTDAGRCTRLRHVADHDVTDLVGVFVNPDETTNPITVTFGIEYPAFTYYECHFEGESTTRGATIAAGSFAQSQPLPLFIPAGAVYYTNTLVVPSAGGSYPVPHFYGFVQNNQGAETSGQLCVVGATDYTTSANPGTAANLYGYGPVAICGTPATATLRLHTPQVGIAGDSISIGVGDSAAIVGAANFESGYLSRACNAAALPYINCGVNGGSGNGFGVAPGTSMMRLEKTLLGYCSHVIWEYITNDFINFSLATIQPRFTSAWAQLAARGAKVFATTCTPRTTSTDGWATTTNQTAVNARFGPETTPSDRQNYNAWLRDGCPMTIATLTAVAVGVTGAGIGRCAVYGPTAALVTSASGTIGHPLTGCRRP